MVEVYKTNVMDHLHAKFLLQKIHERFKNYSANFDLEDCDKILRVEAAEKIDSSTIAKLFKNLNFSLEILPDIPEQ